MAEASLPTILIVDDSRLLLRNLTMTLQRSGYDLLLAENAYEALAQLTKSQVDLVLMDCMMPGMSGLEATRLVRTNSETSHIPVVLMSSSDQNFKYATSVGAQDTITKPLETRLLLEKVNHHLTPYPTEGQVVKLQTLPQPHSGEVLRVQDNKLFLSAPPKELGLRTNQTVLVEYAAEDGSKIKRDAVIYGLSANELTLSLGMKVEVEQRRRHFRKAIEIPVRYRIPGDFYRLARSKDLSGGGMRLSGVSGKLEEGQSLSFQLVVNPSIFLPALGVVRRIIPVPDGLPDVGIEFTNVDPKVEQELVMFLFYGL